MSVPKNLALPSLALVIKVLLSLNSKFSSCLRKIFILSKMVIQSSLEPLIPMIQSSAYLTYVNLLKLVPEGPGTGPRGNIVFFFKKLGSIAL